MNSVNSDKINMDINFFRKLKLKQVYGYYFFQEVELKFLKV